jgi:hypothetical protein
MMSRIISDVGRKLRAVMTLPKMTVFPVGVSPRGSRGPLVRYRSDTSMDLWSMKKLRVRV